MTKFQIALIAIFIGMFGLAVLIFSGIIKIGNDTQTAAGSVVIWGTLPQATVSGYLGEFSRRDIPYTVEYVEVPEENFSEQFIEALASGVGPDLVITDQGKYLKHLDKFYVIPYQSYPLRNFQDTYIDGALMYASQSGIGALPIVVDPLVLYYNKDILSKRGYLRPPTTWEDITRSISLFVDREADGSLAETAIALGEYTNVKHFKDILALLFLQTGNAIVAEDPLTKKYVSNLNVSEPGATTTANALQFYISFANPINDFYTWNRSLPNSLDQFIAGKSAFYLGKASELFTIQERNPNLNFDVTSAPQPANAARPIGYADFTSIAIVKSSKNFITAYNAALEFGGETASSYFSKALSVPPAHRNLLLSERPESPYLSVFFTAAANVFGWLDPDSTKTDGVFGEMVRSVSSGRMSTEAAIQEGMKELNALIKK